MTHKSLSLLENIARNTSVHQFQVNDNLVSWRPCIWATHKHHTNTLTHSLTYSRRRDMECTESTKVIWIMDKKRYLIVATWRKTTAKFKFFQTIRFNLPFWLQEQWQGRKKKNTACVAKKKIENKCHSVEKEMWFCNWIALTACASTFLLAESFSHFRHFISHSTNRSIQDDSERQEAGVAIKEEKHIKIASSKPISGLMWF